MALLLEILLAMLVGYISVIMSDYFIHRFIWHGKWKIVRWPMLRTWLYPHYIHHLVAHHAHARSAKAELLRDGVVPEQLKIQLEQRFRSEPWVQRALQCSNHGLSINSAF